MRNKWQIVLQVFLCFGLFLAIVSTRAQAEYWQYAGGNHELFDDSGKLIKSFTPNQWEQYQREVTATSNCMGIDASCAAKIEEGKTSVETSSITKAGSFDAQAVSDTARAASTSIDPVVQNGLDFAAETGGSLPTALGSTALGGLLMGPLAFTIGVEIGNGLDQLFNIPEWHPFSKSEEESFTKANVETQVKYVTGELCDTETRQINGVETENHYCDPAGSPNYAIERNTCAGTHCYRSVETQITHYQEEGFLPVITIHDTGEIVLPAGFYSWSHQLIFRENTSAHTKLVVKVYYAVKPPGKCPVITEPVLPGTIERGSGLACEPVGVPAPGLITPQIRKSDEEHMGRVPSTAPTIVPIAPPSTITEKDKEKIVEHYPSTPPYIKENSPKEKEEEEELVGTLIIPDPGTELATTYKTRLEGLGFTEVISRTATELETNYSVGPDEVARVSPAPGTRASTTTKVTVTANPSTAPPPAETGGGIGPPVEPGIHFPKLGVLCEGFPFGVPCWLANTVEAWSATGKAPEWGLEGVEIKGTKIEGKVKLSVLEPVMEVVRPALLVFSTIGLVLLFYRFAKGGSPSSGSGGLRDDTGQSEGGG